MGTANKTPYFFKSRPLFGLDIGNGSLKVMQVEAEDGPPAKRAGKHHKPPKVVGYGTAAFDKSAIKDGVVKDPETIAKAAHELFAQHLKGDITSRRVALTIPAYRTFTRSIRLPALKTRELNEAVRLEVEQYTPVPLDQLYLDYTTISSSKTGSEVLAVAVPRKIVDSYLDLSAILGLEPVLIETTMGSAGRLFGRDPQSDVPTIIIDFGSLSSDIAIYDHTIVTTGTVQGGGQVFTDAIEKKLQVSAAEAAVIKTKYGMGLSKRQKEIQAALEPTLSQIVKEIRRLVRYYGERYGAERPLQQIVSMGGGANMPGLSEYLTSNLRLAVRSANPWQYLEFKGLPPPTDADKPMYATAAGLCLAPPREVFL